MGRRRVLQGLIRLEEQWREDVPSAPQLLDLMLAGPWEMKFMNV